jgi:hypothetical protein
LFLTRVNEVKRDPGIKAYANLVSGLFENSQWVVVCSENVSELFPAEEELSAFQR